MTKLNDLLIGVGYRVATGADEATTALEVLADRLAPHAPQLGQSLRSAESIDDRLEALRDASLFVTLLERGYRVELVDALSRVASPAAEAA